MNKVFGALASALLLLATSAVSAQVVVLYTFSGNANGSVNGTPFAAQNFTYTLTGFASTAQNSAFPYSNVLTSGTVAIAGTACASGCAFTTPGNYLVFNTGPGASNVHGISAVGHLDAPGFTLIEACYNCGGTAVNDNLVSPVSPTPSGAANALAPYPAVATSGGNVSIALINAGALTYAAAPFLPTIPTLSEYGLMLLALLLAGTGYYIRRRRKM